MMKPLSLWSVMASYGLMPSAPTDNIGFIWAAPGPDDCESSSATPPNLIDD